MKLQAALALLLLGLAASAAASRVLLDEISREDDGEQGISGENYCDCESFGRK